MQYAEFYREEHPTLLPHSPHSHVHAHSKQAQSHFDPYPTHLPSNQPYQAARSPYAALEPPSTYVSDHSDLDQILPSPGAISHSHSRSPPHRSGTPVSASNGGSYYSHHNSPHPHELGHHTGGSSRGGRAMSAEPLSASASASYRQPSPGMAYTVHHHTPIPASPARSPVPSASAFGATVKVIQWTPQHGEEGTQVTIVLDPLAVTGALSSSIHSPASFGPGSPALVSRRSPLALPPAVNRRFVVLFGAAPAPTKFTRANAIDGNGVGTSMASGPDEQDAFVVLTTFVPSRQSMGPPGERVMVLVQVVDDLGRILEECIVGEWEANAVVHPVTPPRLSSLKRPGDDLEGHCDSPGLRSPARSIQGSPMLGHPATTFLSPSMSNQLLSPRPQPRARSTTPGNTESEAKPQSASLRHPPIEGVASQQPDLLRTSQIPSGPIPSAYGNGSVATYSNKAVLKLQGDLNQMAMGWSNEEWTNRRRLIQFWRHQEGNVINATFRPIAQSEHVPNSIVISCIFRDEWNECFVTSVDTIYLLEALVGVRFTVEEKNRIRRNLEGFKPMTVSKSKSDSEPFFKLIMGFPNPKPRNIEKDVKVFPWKVLANALKKIIGKYSATYSAPVEGSSPSLHIGGPSDEATKGVAPSSQHLSVNNPSASGDPYAHPHSPQVSTGHHSPRINSPRVNSPQIATYPPSRPGSPPAGLSPSPRIGGPTSIAGEHAAYRAPSSAYDFHLEPSSIPASSASTSHAYALGPPDAYPPSANIFPAAEDYGVTSDPAVRLTAPPLNHSRSYSEGPRRGAAPMFISNAGPYAFTPAPEMYTPWEAESDPRGGSDAWKSGDGQGPYGEPRRSASTDGQPYQGSPSVSYSHER